MPDREPHVSCLITAEHAGNRVPGRWRTLFDGRRSLLDGHRGWDPGSGELARALAEALQAPLLEGRITRLLVDLNRSADHPRRFPEFTRALPAEDRAALVRDYWRPHWTRYRNYLDTLAGRIVHIACHSFTPVLDGKTRSTDIGLLYDPSRPIEAAFCRRLGGRLRTAFPDLIVHMNQPYRGVSNGLGQQHRRDYPDTRLITFELEINQRLLAAPGASGLAGAIAAAIAGALLQDVSEAR
ncbi:MAG: N-formylglutamate amidohydrolase [Wenzhouxiangellaceae bacterium]|nr:N-formylglutamate amidohydrolase [Wenzhouxiangellaceae bacterium]